MVGSLQALRIIIDILHRSVHHFLLIMHKRPFLAGYLKQTVLESLVGEILVTQRVHDTDAIDDKAIGIHVRGSRSERSGPKSALRILQFHGFASGELYVHLHFFSVFVLIVERHCPIVIKYRRGLQWFCLCLHHTCATQEHNS